MAAMKQALEKVEKDFSDMNAKYDPNKGSSSIGAVVADRTNRARRAVECERQPEQQREVNDREDNAFYALCSWLASQPFTAAPDEKFDAQVVGGAKKASAATPR